MVTRGDDQSRIFEAMETPSRRGTIVAIIRGSFASRSLYVPMAAVSADPPFRATSPRHRTLSVTRRRPGRLPRADPEVGWPVRGLGDPDAGSVPVPATTERHGGCWRP